jgi:hypothetical protein
MSCLCSNRWNEVTQKAIEATILNSNFPCPPDPPPPEDGQPHQPGRQVFLRALAVVNEGMLATFTLHRDKCLDSLNTHSVACLGWSAGSMK